MAVATLPHDAHGEVDQLYVEVRELRLQGFLLFLISDCVLFASFIFAYLYLRNSGQGWPPPGIQRLDVAFAAWNSVVLFGSGATMHYALENFKRGNFIKYMWFLLATLVLGVGFLGGQAYEYNHLIFGEHVTWCGQRHLRRLVLYADRHARIPRFLRRLLPHGARLTVCSGRLYARQILRHHGRHAVLALRRRDLGRAVLDLLLNLRSRT